MPVDYSNQDITNTNLTGADLSGGNFTNTIATGVNFTNANITNAVFKNTLITGANISTLTFSDLQKGYLLLRALNHTITAVNNLTALTPTQFRIIQPAVSLDTINMIQTVTVKIPNTLSNGNYTIVVSPLINQIVCIFVATNQNIVIATSTGNVRTIRSNGTVVQDVDNANATLSLLKVGSVSYSLTAANGDGVIAMIPVNFNVYQVNGSGLGDVITLTLGNGPTGPTGVTGPGGAVGSAGVAGPTGPAGSTKVALSYTAGTLVNAVVFNFTSVNLLTSRIKGTAMLYVNENWDYGCIRFSGQGVYNSTAQINEQSYYFGSVYTSPAVNGIGTRLEYQDRGIMMVGSTLPTGNFWVCVDFEIDNLRQTNNVVTSQMVCRGRWSIVSKTVGSTATYRAYANFERTNDLTSISSIEFGDYFQNTSLKSMTYASLNIDVIPLPTFTTVAAL